jgi:ornithine cyclodeaminase/alanine dehydrogenase-like protein (mu-crystallin family)
MLVITDADLRRVVDLDDVIESQRRAYRAAADGAMAAEGVLTAVHGEGSLVFAVTGAIAGGTGVAFKIGSENPANARLGISTLQSAVILTDITTAAIVAILNGAAVTALRTSGGVAAGADAIARRDSSTLGILGSGVQAREVARMVSQIRSLDEVRIWSPSREHRQSLIEELTSDPAVTANVIDGRGARFTSECDIVVTCTTSREPVLEGEWLRPGATVLTIGSYAPERNEIDVRASERAARTYVDDVTKAWEWSGPLQRALAARAIDSGSIHPVGKVMSGEDLGRRDDEEILVFHSLGLAIQDAALGALVLARATEQGLGAIVDL